MELTDEVARAAMAYGSALASFNVEEFGTERVSRLTRAEIDERVAAFHRMTQFQPLPGARLASSASTPRQRGSNAAESQIEASNRTSSGTISIPVVTGSTPGSATASATTEK